MNNRRLWIAIALVTIALACGFALLGGGGGAVEAQKAAEAGADAFTGHHAVKVGQELKSQFRAIDSERDRQVEEAQGR